MVYKENLELLIAIWWQLYEKQHGKLYFKIFLPCETYHKLHGSKLKSPWDHIIICHDWHSMAHATDNVVFGIP